MPKIEPQHLGDGVYISDDDFQIWLAANHHDNKVIALDHGVFTRLVEIGIAWYSAQSEKGYGDTLRRLADKCDAEVASREQV